MAFSLTFESVYYADRRIAEPPPELVAEAERQIPLLHPERTHVLSTRDGRAFVRAPLASAQGWYVTYTPKPAGVVTFAELSKGDRFHVFNAAGILLAPVYTKVSTRVCKNASGDWLDVAPTQAVKPITGKRAQEADADTVRAEAFPRFLPCGCAVGACDCETDADNPPCGECGAVHPEPHAAECANVDDAACGQPIDAAIVAPCEKPAGHAGPCRAFSLETMYDLVIAEHRADDPHCTCNDCIQVLIDAADPNT